MRNDELVAVCRICGRHLDEYGPGVTFAVWRGEEYVMHEACVGVDD